MLLYDEMIEAEILLAIGTTNKAYPETLFIITVGRRILWKTNLNRSLEFFFAIDIPTCSPRVLQKISEDRVTKLTVDHFKNSQNVVALIYLKSEFIGCDIRMNSANKALEDSEKVNVERLYKRSCTSWNVAHHHLFSHRH